MRIGFNIYKKKLINYNEYIKTNLVCLPLTKIWKQFTPLESLKEGDDRDTPRTGVMGHCDNKGNSYTGVVIRRLKTYNKRNYIDLN